MTQTIPDSPPLKPRGAIATLLIAVLLLPAVAMLWLGRWRVAVLYVIGLFVWFAAVIFAASRGWLDFAIAWGMGDFVSWIWPYNIVGAIHALLLRKPALPRPWFMSWYVAWALVSTALLLPLLAVRFLAYQPFSVPSESNMPSLMPGDHVFVSRFTYGSSRKPRRGEMAVFRLPVDPKLDYIKRVIGLPGERVQVRAGVLHINDVAVQRERVADFVDPSGQGRGMPVQQYRETLPNGVSYFVLDSAPNGSGESDNTEVYRVPDGKYFMMGDNRDNSLDSRYTQIGVIPEENFIGPAVLVFWNSEGHDTIGRAIP